MRLFRTWLTGLLCLFTILAESQEIDRDAFRTVDSLVVKLGPMRDSSLKSIVRDITKPCQSQACIAQAINLWVANYVEFDCEAARHPRRIHSTASAALMTRKGVCGGYAALVAEMCRIAGLQCHIIQGVAKASYEHIGKVDEDDNSHAWNAILVKDRWYLFDPTWAAGYTDEGNHTFTKQLTDAWFFTDRKLFALSHFPNDKKWQLLDTPIDRSTFVNAPVVFFAAAILRAVPVAGSRGLLRGRQDSSVTLQYTVRHPEWIRSIAVKARDSLYHSPYSIEGRLLTVKVPLIYDDEYELRVLMNHSPAFAYRAKVMPRARRREDR